METGRTAAGFKALPNTNKKNKLSTLQRHTNLFFFLCRSYQRTCFVSSDSMYQIGDASQHFPLLP